jgi:AcrR family transcriptional regulator
MRHTRRIDELVDTFADAAIEAFDDTIRRFEDAVDPGPREQLAAALFAKATLLGELNRWDDSIAMFSELITKFEDDQLPSLKQVVSNARQAVSQMREIRSDNA